MTLMIKPQPCLTVEDYLEGELTSEIRHEYIGGRVYAMTGASVTHNLIAGNLFAALRTLSRGAGCRVFMSDLKVRLQIAGEDIFYYPDVMLCCDPTESETHYRTHPCLIVEVLSKSTQRIDRREILCHRRDNGWFVERITEGEVRLDCLDAAIPLEAIYEDVELG